MSEYVVGVATRRVLACATTVLALASVLSGAAPSIAEQSVATILNAPAAANAIWPGFSLLHRDWAVQDESGVYLVTKKTPPDSFTARGRWYFRQEPLPNFTAGFETNYRMGDLRLVAARAQPSVEQTISLLYHESFHVFQRTWAGLADHVDYGSIQNLLPAHAASIEVERRVLRDAIRSSGPIETLAQQALAVRARRASLVSGDFVQAERQADWLAKWLTSATGNSVYALPVLALPGWFVELSGRGSVSVYNGRQLSQLLRARGAKPLSETDIQRIAHQVQQRCRTVTPKYSEKEKAS